MTWQIWVPATSANLGPGFDCLGLALDLWNEVDLELSGNKLRIEIDGYGADSLPKDEKNPIYQAMLRFAAQNKRALPNGILLKCTNRIPLGSGLGSSAAAVVSGILAASAILGLPENLQERLDCGTEIEGHPDNVAPCLMGGLVGSITQHGITFAQNLPIADFHLILVHPRFTFPTSAARKVLPKEIPFTDAVFNSSRAVLTTEALRTGDLELLKIAAQDKLHQPYRIPLIPGANSAIEAALAAGAAAVVLSGAGPSLLAFAPDERSTSTIASAIENAFLIESLESELFYPAISRKGAYFR